MRKLSAQRRDRTSLSSTALAATLKLVGIEGPVVKLRLTDKTRDVFNYVDVRQLSFDDDQIMAEVKIN